MAAEGDRPVAVGERGHILISDDGGRTWRQLPSPFEGSFFATLPSDGDALLLLGLLEAYRSTLTIAVKGVLLTGITLAIGVATWIFSPLESQADTGILLTFMFLVTMIGAVVVLPALACWLPPDRQPKARSLSS